MQQISDILTRVMVVAFYTDFTSTYYHVNFTVKWIINNNNIIIDGIIIV